MVFRRSETILEARLGLVTARVPGGGAELCEDTSAGQWVTVARPALPAPCPLQGSYTGRLPDGEGLCASSVTQCSDPASMRYRVYR